MWKEHFCKLLNASQLVDKRDRVYDVSNTCDIFTHTEMLTAISHLKTGKAVGNDCLSAESFKYADTSICVFLCMLFNSILYHSYLPSKLMDTVIVPIVKDKKGDLGSKNNFRPIALTTIMSKLFEILILNRYGDLLHSTDNQFGYKKKHATLKQVVDYYRSNSSPVYICFLDASKAFDRVNYDILCKKLASRNLPNVIVRILHVWFSRQCFYVKWGSVLSQSFHATNGVRQGGILSPHLFNVYINELSIRLNSQFFGCHINSICYNHLVYADDTVLLAPSPKGLQMLIDICVAFGIENDIVCNEEKTKCMCVKPSVMKDLYVPTFHLGHLNIKAVEKETYLGYIINADMSDDDHISKEIRNIYARGNMLVRNFKHCMTGVKITLFKTYCSSLYCCPMWTKYRKSTIGKVNVAFNKVFKIFMNVPSSFSPSWLFLICDVLNFPTLRRKLVLSFMKRIKKSSNVLISNSYNFLMTNFMQRYWNKLLRL